MNLRPKLLKDIVGNDDIKKSLKVLIEGSKKNNRRVPHIILNGSSGCGKTTFAECLSNEIGSENQKLNAAALSNNQQIISACSKLKDNDILFIDEIHALNRQQQEVLYTVLEDQKITIGTKKLAKTLPVADFTIIAATTNIGKLNKPFLNRFPIHLFIQDYSLDDLVQIVKSYVKVSRLKFQPDAIIDIARRSKMVPRVAQNLFKWIEDWAMSEGSVYIDANLTAKAFENLKIDEQGLDPNDRLYLKVLEDHCNFLGLATISSISGLPQETITEHIEPYLLRINKIAKTKQGRILSSLLGDF